MSVNATIRRSLVITLVASAAVIVGSAGRTMASPAGVPPSAERADPSAIDRFGPLVELAIRRLRVSDQVAAAKIGTGQPIDDPAREQQELTQVRQQALAMGLDPDATVRFFSDQITASKIVQRGLSDRWTRYPAIAPTSRPDLTTLRNELDQLTTEILAQLLADRDLMGPSATCHAQLVVAEVAGELVDRLDDLHRHALSVALTSVCAARAE